MAQFTTEKQVRKEFWNQHPVLKAKYYKKGQPQNDYNATVRTIFVDWIDSMNKAGQIPTDTADEVTLG